MQLPGLTIALSFVSRMAHNRGEEACIRSQVTQHEEKRGSDGEQRSARLAHLAACCADNRVARVVVIVTDRFRILKHFHADNLA